MFSEPFDNQIKLSSEYVEKMNKIIKLYETKLTEHLEKVEKK